MPKQDYLTVALDGGFGGSFNLVKAVNQHSAKYTTALVTSRPSPYAFGEGVSATHQIETAGPMLGRAERLWICDCGGLLTIARYLTIKLGRQVAWEPFHPASAPLYAWLRGRSLVFFWSGSAYRDNHAAINVRVKGLQCARRYAMCDLLRLDADAMPLMQTYDDLAPGKDKFPKFTVGHTPGLKYKKGCVEKGTPMIAATLDALSKQHDLTYVVLKNMPYADAIKVKAKFHLFVDQIVPDVGGIGKSGLEAMLLGIPTLCDVGQSLFYGQYAGMPVFHVGNKAELAAQVTTLFTERGLLADATERSLAWAQRLRFAPTAQYLDETLVWA